MWWAPYQSRSTFLKQPGLFKAQQRWENGTFFDFAGGQDFFWEASREGRGECLALVIVFLLMRHMSNKYLLGEKEAFMCNGFYFSPRAVFSMWESGTWMRLTAEDYSVFHFSYLRLCLLYGCFNLFHIFSPKDWGGGNWKIKSVANISECKKKEKLLQRKMNPVIPPHLWNWEMKKKKTTLFWLCWTNEGERKNLPPSSVSEVIMLDDDLPATLLFT